MGGGCNSPGGRKDSAAGANEGGGVGDLLSGNQEDLVTDTPKTHLLLSFAAEAWGPRLGQWD